MAWYLEQGVPGVQYNGLNTQKAVDFSGASSITFGSKALTVGAVTSSGSSQFANLTITGTKSGGALSVTSLGGTTTMTTAQSGLVALLDSASGYTVTLPTPSIGLEYNFVVYTSITSNYYKIITDSGSTYIYGGLTLTVNNVGSTVTQVTSGGASNIAIIMRGTTTGGLVGTYIRAVCTHTTAWMVTGTVVCGNANGVLVSPFSTV